MVESPCTRRCEWNEETKVCVGCDRTLDELRSWRKMSDAEKQEVLDRIGKESSKDED